MVEQYVRLIAKKREVDLNVWTGSVGVLTLPDNDETEVEIYLTNTTIDG